MKILVVEDEKPLSDAICKILQDAKHFTDAVYDGEDAVYYIEHFPYDVIILDVMLPKLDGFEVLKNMREKKLSAPVLMLTAKNTVQDKVSGLNFGADDYMTKPFENEELLARVNALSRRTGDIIMNELKFGDLTLNLNSASLSANGNSVQLTHKEFEVLKILFSNPKMTVTTDTIIINVWGMDSDATENNVEAYISFLRRKIKYLNSSVLVKKSQKIGYHLEENNA